MKFCKSGPRRPARTCAEDGRKHPTLAVAHGAAVGQGPALQDVGAAAPLGGVHATLVAAVPLARQNPPVVIAVHLKETERRTAARAAPPADCVGFIPSVLVEKGPKKKK